MLELDVNDPEQLEAVAGDARRPLGPPRRRAARDRLRRPPTRSAAGSCRPRAPRRSPRSRPARSRSRRWRRRCCRCWSAARRPASSAWTSTPASRGRPTTGPGVSKAALESINRYLARDLGPRGVRSNLVAAGPLRTMAASNIEGFEGLAEVWERQAPLGWDLERPRRRSPTRACSCSRRWRARSPARSCTSTAASTRSAPRCPTRGVGRGRARSGRPPRADRRSRIT